jgi:hypothetical protein
MKSYICYSRFALVPATELCQQHDLCNVEQARKSPNIELEGISEETAMAYFKVRSLLLTNHSYYFFCHMNKE